VKSKIVVVCARAAPGSVMIARAVRPSRASDLRTRVFIAFSFLVIVLAMVAVMEIVIGAFHA
jgi:hypothetical protein